MSDRTALRAGRIANADSPSSDRMPEEAAQRCSTGHPNLVNIERNLFVVEADPNSFIGLFQKLARETGEQVWHTTFTGTAIKPVEPPMLTFASEFKRDLFRKRHGERVFDLFGRNITGPTQARAA
jgi:hypothetical protein